MDKLSGCLRAGMTALPIFPKRLKTFIIYFLNMNFLFSVYFAKEKIVISVQMKIKNREKISFGFVLNIAAKNIISGK
jgi:hypothetical protein